jgi:hypothetical protein
MQVHSAWGCLSFMDSHFKPIEPNIKAPNCFFTIVDASALYWITSGIPTVSTQGRTGTSFTIIFVPHSHSYNRILLDLLVLDRFESNQTHPMIDR